MSKREEFEQSLKDLIQDTSQTEPEVAKQISLALVRLDQDPMLFCGDTDGDFTYEDPILANALYFYLESEKIPILTAGTKGASLRKSNLTTWVISGIKTVIYRDEKHYRELRARQPRSAIPFSGEKMHLAIVGDGGYKGDIQRNVLNKIREKHSQYPFDYLIHLGDIYFAGGKSAALENFLAPFMDVGPKVLALVGNHDLYMGGEAFGYIIDVLRQPGRFFSIENDYWIVVCLDTALPAIDLFRNEGKLDKVQMNWLKNLIKTSSGKDIILMSHHYAFSSWGGISEVLKKQLKPIFPNIFAWYWGHEHGCVAYDKESLGFYGACIGNGAFLEKWEPPRVLPAPAWFAEGRCNCIKTSSHYWQHGYLELEITPNGIIELYHLEDGLKRRELSRKISV